MSNAYHCFCLNKIEIVDAKFHAYGADGTDGSEIVLHTHGEGQLALPDATGNTVKIKHWDVDWVDVGTFGPMNSGDQIAIDGALSGFKVTINGKTAHPINGSA